MDFRRNPPALPPLTIMNSTVAAVETFRSLRTWIGTITLTLLRKRPSRGCISSASMRKFNLPHELLKQFYSAIESVLCSSITVCFGSAIKTDIRRLTTDSQDRWEDYRCPSTQPPITLHLLEWGTGLRKLLCAPHTQLTLSLNSCPLAGATVHHNS